jgi:hypothetical protein
MEVLSNLGIFPIILLSVFVEPLFGEAPWPKIEWGFSQPDFSTLFAEYTVFGLGFQPLSMFVQSIPMVLATYIVLFGDVLQSRAIVSEADDVRRDEKIDYNLNRAHLIFGGRNTIMSILGPDITMCGPMWASYASCGCRTIQGWEKSNAFYLWRIAGSFRWGTNTGLLLLPIVSLVQPILGVALALTLLIQGHVSVRIGIM